MLFVFIYVYWCPTRFPHHMMFVSFNNNTTGATSGAGTAYHSGAPGFTPRFLWGLCCSIHSYICILAWFDRWSNRRSFCTRDKHAL